MTVIINSRIDVGSISSSFLFTLFDQTSAYLSTKSLFSSSSRSRLHHTHHQFDVHEF